MTPRLSHEGRHMLQSATNAWCCMPLDGFHKLLVLFTKETQSCNQVGSDWVLARQIHWRIGLGLNEGLDLLPPPPLSINLKILPRSIFSNIGVGDQLHCKLPLEIVLSPYCPPLWRRGSGLDYGSGDLGSIPGVPSLHAAFSTQKSIRASYYASRTWNYWRECACGPSDGKEVKYVFGRPGAHVRVGLARKRPLAANGVGARQQVYIWKLDTSIPTKHSPYKSALLQN